MSWTLLCTPPLNELMTNKEYDGAANAMVKRFRHLQSQTTFRPMNNPRFRTMHDAGKYLAAQMYPEGRKLESHDYGAVDRYIENPAWKLARYEAVANSNPSCSHIIDHSQTEPLPGWDNKFPDGTKMSSHDWYAYYRNDYVIIIASGWEDDVDGYEFWNYTPITEEEFRERLFKSIIEPV